MVEYKRKFNQFSRYTPYLVNTEAKKARYFEKGLCREITCILAGLELPTYAEVSRRPQVISTSLGLEASMPKQLDNKRKWDNKGFDKNTYQNKK